MQEQRIIKAIKAVIKKHGDHISSHWVAMNVADKLKIDQHRVESVMDKLVKKCVYRYGPPAESI